MDNEIIDEKKRREKSNASKSSIMKGSHSRLQRARSRDFAHLGISIGSKELEEENEDFNNDNLLEDAY